MSLSERSPWLGGQHGFILGFCKTIQNWAKLCISILAQVHGSRIIQKIQVHQIFWIFGTNKNFTKCMNIGEDCATIFKKALLIFTSLIKDVWIPYNPLNQQLCIFQAVSLVQQIVWYFKKNQLQKINKLIFPTGSYQRVHL